MRISDWSSDVCSSDLVRIWAGGRYAHRVLDARRKFHFFRWRIRGLFRLPVARRTGPGGARLSLIARRSRLTMLQPPRRARQPVTVDSSPAAAMIDQPLTTGRASCRESAEQYV